MMEASPSAPFVVAEPDLLLELMVIASSNLGAPSSKPFEHQGFLKTDSRALTAIIGTKGHQSAHSGTESPEKVPNYVLEAFTRVAATDLHRRVPVRDGAGRYVHRRAK